MAEITVTNGTLGGRIVELYDKSKLDKLCEKCPDDRKNNALSA